MRRHRLGNVRVGGRYWLGQRRVRCVALGWSIGSAYGGAVVWRDVDSDERHTGYYGPAARFRVRRLGP